MSYSHAVKNMIKKSGATLQDIANRCTDAGVQITPSYLSKLQSGKQAPASEEVNIAIAEACNGDPDDLLFEAYLEKAPTLLKDFVSKLISSLKKVMINVLPDDTPKALKQATINHINFMPDRELISIIAHDEDDPLTTLGNTYFGKDFLTEDLRMPISPITGIPMPDNSMMPIIPEGALLQLTTHNNFKDGDIIVAETPDKKILVRRFVKLGAQSALIAENREYESITLKRKDIKVIARVKSFVKEL